MPDNRIVLSLMGYEIELKSFRLIAMRDVDKNGKPISNLKVGSMTMVLESSNDLIWDWIGRPDERKDGEIRIFDISEKTSEKIIAFRDAIISNYELAVNNDISANTYEEIWLFAREIRINDYQYKSGYEF